MPDQSYENHVRKVPGYGSVLIVIMATIVGSLVNLYESWGDHQRLYSASLILVLSVCLLLIGLFARSFALKAQDRGVRAEENLRHFVLTGKLLDPRLTLGQIIALRFASDGEVADLARKAADQGTSSDEIKRSIKNWRPDTHRV